jgi:hypothetical protein
MLEVFARHCWVVVSAEQGFPRSANAWRPVGRDATYCWTEGMEDGGEDDVRTWIYETSPRSRVKDSPTCVNSIKRSRGFVVCGALTKANADRDFGRASFDVQKQVTRLVLFCCPSDLMPIQHGGVVYIYMYAGGLYESVCINP